MAQPKLSKKELKEDEFLSAFEKATRYASLHAKSFTFAAIVLVLLIVGFIGARIYFERYEARASLALFAADQSYRENVALISEDSPMERKGMPDFEKPLKLYQEVVRLFPRSDSAQQALYQSAQCHYRLTKYQDAIAAFQKYLQGNPRGKFSVLAGLGLGYCFEQEGQYDKALAAYATAIDGNPDDPLIGEAFVSSGRCQEMAGKKEDAISTYTQVVERFPNSSWKAYAERKLLFLRSQ